MAYLEKKTVLRVHEIPIKPEGKTIVRQQQCCLGLSSVNCIRSEVELRRLVQADLNALRQLEEVIDGCHI